MKPLEGLRVISIEQFAAGPYGSMYLADMGADVIKIENDESGDPARSIGPYFLESGSSQVFEGWNTNKRSLRLNLKTEAGRAQFEDLVANADAVANNLRGDQPEKLRLDFASLAKLNERIVCLHLSAYGRDNSRRAWPGYDFLMQAEAGLMHLTGDPRGDPVRFGASVVDYMTGVTGMLGLLAAVRSAQISNRGCDVDVSLFDVALHMLSYAGTWYLNEGFAAERLPRGAHLSVTPVQTLRTADGWIYVMCMTQKFWLAMLDVLGCEQLQVDERFRTPQSRTEHREALTVALDREFMRQSTAHWLERLSGILPVAPVLGVREALENPFVCETGMVASVPHPGKKDFRLLANPLKFNQKRLSQQPCRPYSSEGPE